jgi:hypothetical protein
MFAASKTGGVVASSGDPYWTSVSLLTNFENNLTFQDGSTNNLALTRVNTVNPSLNTPFTGGVGGSEYFNAATGGYLSGPNTTALQMGTGDYTVEFWMYQTNVAATQVILEIGRPSTSGSPGFQIDTIGGVVTVYGGPTDATLLITAGSTQVVNTWYHIALTRQSSSTKLFINGTQSGSTATDSTNYSQAYVWVGANGGGASGYVNGFLSNIRVLKGTALYTTTFTPPTAPLTAITNTSLLITGTGQGMFNNSTFVDQGPNALTVTATGAPVYSGLSPFGNTYPGSVLFNGTSQYLSAPSNAAFDLGSSSFTVEAWVNPSAFNAYGYAVASRYAFSGSGSGWVFRIGATILQFVRGNDIVLTGTISASVATWYHVAAVRNGSTLTLYLNGTQVAQATSIANFTDAATTLQIGSTHTIPDYANGYTSNFRITKGTAVYTANFTPSTTPLTAITNTSLLVRGDTGAFYDLSNVGNPESGSGSPVVTTQVKKFGNESGFFNGTASYLTAPDNAAFNMGAVDFTLEAWIYLTSTPYLQADAGANVINKDGKFFVSWAQYNLYVNSALKVCANFSSVPNGGAGPTATIVGTTTLSLNTWYYVAVTRSGVNGTVWVNSVSNGTTASIPATLASGARSLYIGYEESQAAFAYFPGYIDDIRITKGVARTITTPTATFPTGP